ERPAIALRFRQIPRVLGIEVPRDRVVAILNDLGLELLDESAEACTFRPPSWRSDLEREIDLIEEVARIYGYGHIPEDRPVPRAGWGGGRGGGAGGAVRATLRALGLDEAVTYSLVADEQVVPLQGGATQPPIRVEHSARKREVALRQSLTPSLLAARAHNE